VICIDIPIGLLDRPGRRGCDVEARRMLGRNRASSVFPPPSRRSLSFRDYPTASEVNFQLTGRRLNKQSFNISQKVREVDEAMEPEVQERVREAHPELCFQALNCGVAIRLNKKTAAGRQQRWRLLRGVLPRLSANPILPPALRACCAADDYVDALVCAWTAVCVEQSRALHVPSEPEIDGRGVRMEIWYPG
jgi:predicted RNase H-like nuclease